MVVDVTGQCNMHCPHCYAETFAKTEPVPESLLQVFFEEAYFLGVSHYVFQGGEPTVAPDRLEMMLKSCRPDETYINVVSNGWNMTPDTVRWLKSLKVDKIALSLDSGIAEEHDRGRMPGSHERVIQAVSAVLSEGLICSISTIVTRTSLYSEGFKAAYRFAADNGIRMDLQIAEPVGNWDGRKDNLMSPEDSAYIQKLHNESPLLNTGKRMITRDIYTPHGNRCPAGTEFLALASDGTVLPCNFLQFSLGKIGERPLKEMREDILSSPWFSGQIPDCLAGENSRFIDAYIVPNKNCPKPLDAFTVFDLKRTRNERI